MWRGRGFLLNKARCDGIGSRAPQNRQTHIGDAAQSVGMALVRGPTPYMVSTLLRDVRRISNAGFEKIWWLGKGHPELKRGKRR
jgi:hypothetical protein